MTTPQEGGNILPFPRRLPPEVPATNPTQASSEPIDDEQDRVLAIDDILSPFPGEILPIRYLRALPLGISSGALFPHTQTEDVPEAVAKLGVHQIELMLQTRSEYESEFAQLLLRKSRQTRVEIHSIHSMHQLHRMWTPYARRYADERALFSKAIHLTATVGAGVLVWHGVDRKMCRTDEDWERFIALTDDLAAECAGAGIWLGIENVSAGALATVRDVARFATRLADIPNVGFVFDPFQAVEAGANPFMMLAAMGNRVINVHISDASESDKLARHLPPGDGDLPWSALLRAIAGSGYRGPLMIEGPLGTDDVVMTRIRETFDPLFRSVFTFPPEGIVENRPLIEVEDWTMRTEPPHGVAKGIALFNERKFYEQHEEIEHEWHAERGPLRRLYQGLLQIGVGFYHALNRNHAGAVLLLTQGTEKVEAFTPQALGIDTARLVAESHAAIEAIVAAGEDRIAEFDPASIPRIHYVD